MITPSNTIKLNDMPVTLIMVLWRLLVKNNVVAIHNSIPVRQLYVIYAINVIYLYFSYIKIVYSVIFNLFIILSLLILHTCIYIYIYIILYY